MERDLGQAETHMLRKLLATLPREGALTLVVAFCMLAIGWSKGINLLILLTFILAAVVLFNWILSGRQVKRIAASRRWAGPAFAGVQSHWDLQIENRGPQPLAGFMIADSAAESQREWFVDRVKPGQTVRLAAAGVFQRRGIQRLQPVSVHCSYPFGLARRQRTFGGTTECVVLPRLGSVNMTRFRQWLQRILRSSGRLHRIARPSMIHQDDLHGLRAFRPGDNPRWIHWRTSARRNLKMVREFEEASGMSLVVVLDATCDVADQSDPKFEAAVSLAASICWEWCRHHEDHLALGITGPTLLIHRGRPTQDLALEMLRSLALVEGQPLSAAEQAASAKFENPTNAPILLIGARPNEILRGRLQAAWRQPVVSLTVESARDFYATPDQNQPSARRKKLAV